MEGKITAIKRQKKDRVRASIFVNEEFAFGVNEQTIEEFRLRKGDFIDELLLGKIREFDYWIDAKRIALSYLNYRSRSEKEIRERLVKEDIPEPVVLKVMEFLKSYELVNDEAWSKAFINDKLMRKPISSRQLEFNLKQKGVAKEIVEKAIADLNDTQSDLERALAAGEKRWERIARSESDERKRKQKLFTFLASRGFSFEVIDKVYKKLAPNGREEEFDIE